MVAAYPAGWTLRIPAAGIDAVITPKLGDQEDGSVPIPNLFYCGENSRPPM